MASKKKTAPEAVSTLYKDIMAMSKAKFKEYVIATPEGREWLRAHANDTMVKTTYPRMKVWEAHHRVKALNKETGKMEYTGEVVGRYVWVKNPNGKPKEEKVAISLFNLKLKYCEDFKIAAEKAEAAPKKTLAEELLEGI